MVAGVRKKHGETGRTGHINYNSTETQALRETVSGTEWPSAPNQGPLYYGSALV